jgi:hypothetical protein
MPAKNPRLTITMQPALHALFRRLSELTGQSQSSLVFELLDGSQPAIYKVIQLIEASNNAKEQLAGSIGQDLESAQDRVEQQLCMVLDRLGDGQFAQETMWEAQAIKHRRRTGSAQRVRGGDGAAPPPVSNRGVRSLTKQQKSAKAQGQK